MKYFSFSVLLLMKTYPTVAKISHFKKMKKYPTPKKYKEKGQHTSNHDELTHFINLFKAQSCNWKSNQ